MTRPENDRGLRAGRHRRTLRPDFKLAVDRDNDRRHAQFRRPIGDESNLAIDAKPIQSGAAGPDIVIHVNPERNVDPRFAAGYLPIGPGRGIAPIAWGDGDVRRLLNWR